MNRPVPTPVTLFWRRGDLTNTSIVLLGTAAVGAILIAIGAR